MSIPQHLIDHFDTRAWLEDIGVPWSRDKNTSQNWISIPCPFCPDPDPSTHLGIAPWQMVSCWRCGHKGSITHLIRKLDPDADIIQTLKDYRLFSLRELKKKISIRSGKNCNMPRRAGKTFSPSHLEYLRKRRFNPHTLIQQYDLYATGPIFGEEKDWSYRIIAPVFLERVIVNFIGLDITSTRKDKYKNQKNEKVLVPIKEVLYNLDSVSDKMLIVEGITDVWRMGPGTVATMGIEFTHAQVKLIQELKLKKITIMFDSEKFAHEAAEKFASALRADTITVIPQIIKLPSKPDGSKSDPADLSEEDVREIRRIAFHE